VLGPIYRGVRHLVGRWMFDRRYGVHTEDRLDVEQLGLRSADSVDYIPSTWLLLPLVLRRRDVSRDDVFLDAGSGMGRVVLQAAVRYPFRRVIGVEVSERLHAVAVANIHRNEHRLRSADVQLFNGDILEFRDLDEVSVVFLYNPFRGATFEEFVRRLVASVDRHPRPLRIIYVNPCREALLISTGRIEHDRTHRLGRWEARTYRVLPRQVHPTTPDRPVPEPRVATPDEHRRQPVGR
jgi:hypothetical protein